MIQSTASMPGIDVINRQKFLAEQRRQENEQFANSPKPSPNLTRTARDHWFQRVQPLVKAGRVAKKHQADLNEWCRAFARLSVANQLLNAAESLSQPIRVRAAQSVATAQSQYDRLEDYFGDNWYQKAAKAAGQR